MAKTLAEKIAVMQAYQEGKEIEFRPLSEHSQHWLSVCDQDPLWNWVLCDYRIKPKTYWVNLYNDPNQVGGVVGYRHATKDIADFFTAGGGACNRIACVEITE